MLIKSADRGEKVKGIKEKAGSSNVERTFFLWASAQLSRDLTLASQKVGSNLETMVSKMTERDGSRLPQSEGHSHQYNGPTTTDQSSI